MTYNALYNEWQEVLKPIPLIEGEYATSHENNTCMPIQHSAVMTGLYVVPGGYQLGIATS